MALSLRHMAHFLVIIGSFSENPVFQKRDYRLPAHAEPAGNRAF
jgi:hypothetical protein